MIEIAAVVTAVENGYLEVESASKGCGRCHEPGGCGGVSLGSMLCAKPRRLRVRNNLPGPVQVGDLVDVGVADGILGQAALVTYALPLAGLLLGALAGAGGGDIGAILGGMAGLGMAWFLARRLRRKAEARAGDLAVVRHRPAQAAA